MYGEMPEVTLDGQEKPVQGFKFSVPNPPKTAVLRLPTSEELRVYSETIKKARARQKDDSPRSFRPEFELFQKVKVAGDDFDEYESRFAVIKLTEVSVKSCERIEDHFEVTLETPFGEATHTLEIPTAKQLFQTVYAGKPAARLWEQSVKRVNGYKDGQKQVPEHHQEAVAAAVTQKVGEIYEGSFNPNR